MKAVSLTDRIKYLHCQDEEENEGGHGVLILTDTDGMPTKVVSVDDQTDFKFWYKNFSLIEKTEAVAAPWYYAL